MVSRKIRVIIADDSPFTRGRMLAMLSEIPEVEVIGQAKDGEQAIAASQALNPDVAILDVRMPGKSGIEVLQQLKKDKPELVVMMLTNYPYPQYRNKCLDLGASFFFNKSTDFNKVIAVLRQLSQERQGEGNEEIG